MTKQCPRCEKHVEALANFCKHCGADIASFANKLGKKCKTCKAIVDPLARFCNFCGDDLEKLAHMGPIGMVVLVAILTAIVVLGGFVVYGFTVKVPYVATIPYTILETYTEMIPVTVEKCDSTSQFNQRFDFTAKPTFLKNQGFGFLTKRFPDVVNGCRITGHWITNNQVFLQQKQYCHEAKGTFNGYADQYTQYVVNDPEAFDWRGQSPRFKEDPAPEKYEGYSAYTYLCDIRGYENKEHFVRAKLEGFGTNKLSLLWEYFDDNTRPRVDVFVDLNCDLGVSGCRQMTEQRAIEKQRAVTKYKEETRYRFLIQEWFTR